MIPFSQPPFDFRAGTLLLVNKPKGWTSFDVVNKIRYAIRKQYGQKKFKVGHAGTLDPMATGLLVLCTGKWTKRLQELQGLPKTYTGTFTLGATTPSYDAETEPDETFPTDHITEELLANAVASQTGDIDQVPPMFSAIKVDGQRLYKLARKGEVIEIKARPVHIGRFELTRTELPEVDFSVDCSKGTYIRSLAYDVGSGAYLTALCRTKIGEYSLEDAWEVAELFDYINELERIEG
jgi:tRNA pseudouridine55 synthase